LTEELAEAKRARTPLPAGGRIFLAGDYLGPHEGYGLSDAAASGKAAAEIVRARLGKRSTRRGRR
jgi:hypothetical protein